MKSKEEQIDELISGIREMSETIKKKRKENLIKMDEIKIKEKVLDTKKAEKRVLMEKNMEMRERLDQAIRINKGESNVVRDFKIIPEELLNFIPMTPLEGIKKINESLGELRDTLKKQSFNKNERKEKPYVSVKYMGQNLKYLIPEIHEYTFYQLLEDTCAVFTVPHQEYYFKDNSNCVWPLVPPVLNYINGSKSELQLYLTKKNLTNKNKNEEILNKELENGSSQTIKFIDKLFAKVSVEKAMTVIEKEEFKINRSNLMKANRENEILQMIEKTFGSKICSLFFYLFFMIYIMFYVISKNAVSIPLQIYNVLTDNFYSSQYMINYTIFDFYTKDQTNNYNTNNYSYYQVYTSLNEMRDIRLLDLWLTTVFFPQLGFKLNGTFDFMQRHKLIGPIRFFQIRQKLDDTCTIANIYCYNSFSIPETNNNTFVNKPNSSDLAFKQKCLNGSLISAGCALYNEGYQNRVNNYSYAYSGQMGDYSFDQGFYFDLSPNISFTADDTENFSKHLSHYWLDLSTRLLTITFNAYMSDLNDNQIISVTLYIEIGSSQIIVKSFDVSIFKLYINLEYLFFTLQKQETVSVIVIVSSVISLISKYLNTVFYLILLSIYSFSSLNYFFKTRP